MRKNCLAWTERYANIISNLSNSDSAIIQNHVLHYFNVFIGCWLAQATRTSIVIDICSVFLKPVIPQLNFYSAHSRRVKRHSQHFKYPCTFNFIFYTGLNTVSLIHFVEHTKTRLIFLFVKNKLTIQNGWTTNLFICQK